MSYLLKFRMPLLVLFFAAIGLSLSLILKLGELEWYYIIATPLIATVIGLMSNFFTDAAWNKKLREKSGLITVGLCVFFLTALVLHLQIYINGTFRYEDVNKIYRTYIKGYTYTEIARQFKSDNPTISSDADLLYEGFGGISGKNDVWTQPSIRRTTLHLIISYCSVILALSALISWILGVANEKKYLDPQKTMQAILSEKGESNYEKYMRTYAAKQNEEKYKMIKANVFLSYASNQRNLAEDIFYSLANNGHMVFFDRNSLPSGFEYNTAINTAIKHSDMFIFLISPDSVAAGHYTLSELKFAEEHWPAANGVVLPVMSVTTEFNLIPGYVRSVTILIPQGNLVAEVTTEVEKLYAAGRYKTNFNIVR